MKVITVVELIKIIEAMKVTHQPTRIRSMI